MADDMLRELERLKARIEAAKAECRLMEEGGQAFRIDYGCTESDPVVEVEDILKALDG